MVIKSRSLSNMNKENIGCGVVVYISSTDWHVVSYRPPSWMVGEDEEVIIFPHLSASCIQSKL